jgi:hypothetical protein
MGAEWGTMSGEIVPPPRSRQRNAEGVIEADREKGDFPTMPR